MSASHRSYSHGMNMALASSAPQGGNDETVKKKRGMPIKYAPDASNMSLAGSQLSGSEEATSAENKPRPTRGLDGSRNLLLLARRLLLSRDSLPLMLDESPLFCVPILHFLARECSIFPFCGCEDKSLFPPGDWMNSPAGLAFTPRPTY